MAAVSGAADQSLTEFQWSIENEVHLYHAMIGNKPAGINKHFNMASICERLSNCTGKDVTSDSVWRYLDKLYNLEMIDDIEGTRFPNDQKDFSLPDNEYGTMMKLKAKEAVVKIEESEDRSASPRVQTTTKSSSRGTASKDTPKSSNKKDNEKGSKSQKENKDSSISGHGSTEASNTPSKPDKESTKSDPRRDSKDSSSSKDTPKSASGNNAKSTPAKEPKSTKPSRSSIAADKSEDNSKSNEETNSAKRGNKRSTRGSLKSEEPTPPARRRRI